MPFQQKKIKQPHMIPFLFFFFTDPATTEIYTLSLHDALPISSCRFPNSSAAGRRRQTRGSGAPARRDRKSTRLNSSHVEISYAVFFLKKKNIRLTYHVSLHTCPQLQILQIPSPHTS